MSQETTAAVPTPDAMLAAARAGDMNAFADLFESYRPVIHRVAWRLVGANDCDDVVMDTYLKAWRALPAFGGRSSVSTWLCRIAHNCALDVQRRHRRRDARHVSSDDPDALPLVERIADPAAASPDREAARRDLGTAIGRALDRLSPELRTTVLLREVDGLSYRELAAATHVSMGTVMSRLFHARRRLRRLLEAGDL